MIRQYKVFPKWATHLSSPGWQKLKMLKNNKCWERCRQLESQMVLWVSVGPAILEISSSTVCGYQKFPYVDRERESWREDALCQTLSELRTGTTSTPISREQRSKSGMATKRVLVHRLKGREPRISRPLGYWVGQVYVGQMCCAFQDV